MQDGKQSASTTGVTSLIRGDALHLPLRDDSVDLIITSPPYFALRSYTDGGEHYDGQIGSEPTPQAFLEALWAVTEECRRVLKPSGSMFVNLGDKYAGSNAQSGGGASTLAGGASNGRTRGDKGAKKGGYIPKSKTPNKSLMGLPWRYAIGCIDQLDLILRAEIVWSKPNGLPESVTDRVRRSHEQWFMFTKSPRYYSAMDEIRESRSEVVEPGTEHLPGCPLFVGPSNTLRARPVSGSHERLPGIEDLDLPDKERANVGVQGHDVARTHEEHEVGSAGAVVPSLVGRAPEVGENGPDLVDDGGVPVVDVQSQVGASVAAVGQGDGALPVDDPRQPRQVCLCGHATYPTGLGKLPGSVWTIPTEPLTVPEHVGVDHFAAFPQEWPRRIILGWSPPDGIVVDPFAGTGTTVMVARALGRTGIGIDLSADYLRLARWRVFESGAATKALRRTNAERQGTLL